MADNWYLILELDFDPPVEDESVIALKIDEKRKFWSSKSNHPRDGAKYRTWLQQISQIQSDMIGPDNKRKEIAAAAAKEVYSKVDKYLNTIKKKGFITPDEIKKLADKLKMNESVIKTRADFLNILIQEGASLGMDEAEAKNIYEKYYNTKISSAAKYDNLVNTLQSFSVSNLYEFLYRGQNIDASNLSCDELRKRAGELKTKEFFRNDSISGNGAAICSECEITFKDEASKAAYDEYLEYTRRKTVLNEAKDIADISGKIDEESAKAIVLKLASIFKDIKLSEKILTAFCIVKKISLAMENNSAKEIVICRCGTANDVSDGRTVCYECGKDLFIKCPNCGSMNAASVKVCKCRFRFENINKSQAMCDLAQINIDAFEFDAAEIQLSEAEKMWSGNPGIREVRSKLNDYKAKVGELISKLRISIENKRFYEAKSKYQSIKNIFPNYSDASIEQEIEVNLKRAASMVSQIQSEKDPDTVIELCINVLEICSDAPGIKERIPAPKNIENLTINIDQMSRENTLTWSGVADRMVSYVVVRNTTGWKNTVDEKEVVFRGNATSFTDQNIKSGVTYFYNVFASRAGVYSQGVKNDLHEATNYFDVCDLVANGNNSSVELKWGDTPDNASVKIYIIDKGEKLVKEVKGNSAVITELENDVQYNFRVSFVYSVKGTEKETKGICVSAVPTCPPSAIDTLRIRPSSKQGVFDAVWIQNESYEVRLYSSDVKPQFDIGEILSVDEIDSVMNPVSVIELSSDTKKSLNPGEKGASFIYSGVDALFVSAVVIKSGSAVFGSVSRTKVGESVNIKSVNSTNNTISIEIEPMQKASGYLVLYAFDHFAVETNDTTAKRQHFKQKKDLLNILTIKSNETQKYYFTVFAEYEENDDIEYSVGADYLFNNGVKTIISYSISVSKSLFTGKKLELKFSANDKNFTLPDILVMTKTGGKPMFESSGELLEKIPSQQVKGSVTVKIDLPKGIAKNTYVNLFVDKNNGSFQLKSNENIEKHNIG